MALVSRQHNPGPFRHYQDYKSFLRLDFCHTCVYCSVHEAEHGGFRQFHIEHHRPKHEFPELELDYLNLLYSCNVCGPYKSNDWPSEDPAVDGRGYLNPCEHDYSEHFELEADGTIKPLSQVAHYMIERLRLNREQIVGIRVRRLKFLEAFSGECSKYDRAIKLLESRIGSLSNDAVAGKEEFEDIVKLLQDAKEELLERHDAYWRVPYEAADLR